MTACRIGAIDDRLGSASGRFFGEGYKDVERRLTDIRVISGAAGLGEIHGTAGLRYSTQWSVKGGRKQLRPHLSTPDGLLLAVNLVEAYLVHAFRLSADERRQMWLVEVFFQAGARPLEDLDDFEVSAVHHSYGPESESRLGYRSSFRCRIGVLRINCVVEHGELRGELRPGYYPTADDLLGAPVFRHYGAGYRSNRLTLDEVDLDVESNSIQAQVQGMAERWGAEGLEGAYPLSISMLDGMVALVQLAQVLIYEVDHLERSKSNTLWMRRAVLSRCAPDRPVGQSAGATVSVDTARSLQLGGATWRTFDLVADFGDFRATAALAHQLPAGSS